MPLSSAFRFSRQFFKWLSLIPYIQQQPSAPVAVEMFFSFIRFIDFHYKQGNKKRSEKNEQND